MVGRGLEVQVCCFGHNITHIGVAGPQNNTVLLYTHHWCLGHIVVVLEPHYSTHKGAL